MTRENATLMTLLGHDLVFLMPSAPHAARDLLNGHP
jgi:hypothetical protein